MKPFFKKFFGILCIIMCVADVLTFIANKVSDPALAEKSLGPAIFLFCVFAIGAWCLLTKPRDSEKDNGGERQDEQPVKVGVGTAILVYAVDGIIVILVWVLPVIIAILCNASNTATSNMGFVGMALAIAAIILLPGPKEFQRMVNKRKNQ